MDLMKKFLEQVQAEMEIKNAAAAPKAARLYCPRCGAGNEPLSDYCAGCGAAIGGSKQKGKGKLSPEPTVPTLPVTPPPVPPEALTPPRPLFSLTPQSMRQGLIYKILLGPPRALQDDFD